MSETVNKKANVKEIKVKKETPMEQKLLNECMRNLRKTAYKFITTIKNSPSKESQLADLKKIFESAIVSVKSLNDKEEMKDIVSKMTDEEKNLLRQLLNA